ncbi:uncharacterized protein LOC142976219 [Anticarsia gemmatalis]|uniref:uncharacterized protein LOC142976219 n=1 Tax=Anticarsia gemmatalis TaxID=129554 RepID=UPI003F771F18
MKLIVLIVAVLGSVAVEGGYFPRHYGPPPPHHGRDFHGGPHGAPGPHGPHWPHGPFGPHRQPNEDVRRFHDSNESSDSDSGPDSSGSGSGSSSEEIGWHGPGRKPCRGWRCPPRPTRGPWSKTSCVTKPTTPKRTVSTNKPWWWTPAVTKPTKGPVRSTPGWWETTAAMKEPSTVVSSTLPWWQTTPSQSKGPSTEESSTLPWWQTTPSQTKGSSTVGSSTLPWWQTTPSKTKGPSTEESSTLPWWETTPSPTKDPSTNWWDTTTSRPTQGSTSATRPTGVPTPKPSSSTWNPNTISTGGIPSSTTGPLRTTTASQVILDCIKNCQATNEYNPVCGTNFVTYDNIGKLNCAKQCGVAVDLLRKFACPPTPPPDNGRSTTSATEATMMTGRTTSLTDFQRCMSNCLITSDYSPVCGTDLVTYINKDRIKCAQECGLEIQVLCNSSCAACGHFKPTSTSTTKSTHSWSTTSSTTVRTTPTMSMEQCIRLCPATSEKNPVCGTNNVTYSNPGHLLCAQLCGQDVKIARFERCSSSVPAEEILFCISTCPVTSEYNPVCGTNNVTYTNRGHLNCAISCGADVKLRGERPCALLPDPNTSTSSNGQTTTSITKDTPSSTSWNPWTSSSSWTTPMTPTTSKSTTIGFTIPPDVLSSIFGGNTDEPSTQPTISTIDDDDEFSIDPRFGNSNEEEEYRKEFVFSK